MRSPLETKAILTTNYFTTQLHLPVESIITPTVELCVPSITAALLIRLILNSSSFSTIVSHTMGISTVVVNWFGWKVAVTTLEMKSTPPPGITLTILVSYNTGTHQ